MELSPYDLIDPRDLTVPQDRPFVSAEARAMGVSRHRLGEYLRHGLLVSPLRGVYHVLHLDDRLGLRIACVRLVAPGGAVICVARPGTEGARRAPAQHRPIATPGRLMTPCTSVGSAAVRLHERRVGGNAAGRHTRGGVPALCQAVAAARLGRGQDVIISGRPGGSPR